MSLADQLFKLDITTKSVILNILLLMPFWYIDLYLFKKEFFLSAPVYLPIVFSFCLTVAYLIPFYISEYIKLPPGLPTNTYEHESFRITSIAIPLLLICAITFLCYFMSPDRFDFVKTQTNLEEFLAYTIGASWELSFQQCIYCGEENGRRKNLNRKVPTKCSILEFMLFV